MQLPSKLSWPDLHLSHVACHNPLPITISVILHEEVCDYCTRQAFLTAMCVFVVAERQLLCLTARRN